MDHPACGPRDAALSVRFYEVHMERTVSRPPTGAPPSSPVKHAVSPPPVERAVAPPPAVRLLTLMEYIQIVSAGPSAMARALRQYVEPPAAPSRATPPPAEAPPVAPEDAPVEPTPAGDAAAESTPPEAMAAEDTAPGGGYVHHAVFAAGEAPPVLHVPSPALEDTAKPSLLVEMGKVMVVVLLVAAAFYGAYALLDFLGFDSPLTAFGL